MNIKSNLTWNDRLALINHYKPSKEIICQTFGCTTNELETAQELARSSVLRPNTHLDVTAYIHLFNPERPLVSSSLTVTSTIKPKITKGSEKIIPNRRGRKGNKITTAFNNIPFIPEPAEDFAKNYGVSLAVLRQGKRFDKTPEKGLVHVKKQNGTLMVWREKTST